MRGKPDYDILGGLVSLNAIRTIVGYSAGMGETSKRTVMRDLLLGGDSEVFQNNLDAIQHLGILEVSEEEVSPVSGLTYNLLRPLILDSIKRSEEPGVQYVGECISQVMQNPKPVRVEEILRASRQKFGVAKPAESLSLKKRFLVTILVDLGLGIRIGTVDDPSILRMFDPSLLEECKGMLFPKTNVVGIYELFTKIHEKLFPCLISERPIDSIVSAMLILKKYGHVDLIWEADGGLPMIEDSTSRRPLNIVKFHG